MDYGCPTLCGWRDQSRMILTLETNWSSAHFYKNSGWSDEKNKSVFGRCYTEFGHGHDYRLEVSFVGQDIDSNVESLKHLLFELREQLDHQHLNFVIPEFKTKIPTTENLASFCRQNLISALSAKKNQIQIQRLRLFERQDLWAEIISDNT
jgi:6-pyruvoyltetrahydropterin/6-carboxytetrahydropterin synthase